MKTQSKTVLAYCVLALSVKKNLTWTLIKTRAPQSVSVDYYNNSPACSLKFMVSNIEEIFRSGYKVAYAPCLDISSFPMSGGRWIKAIF